MTDKQKNYIRAKAIEARNKERIKEQTPNIEDRTGIYVLTREENGIRYGMSVKHRSKVSLADLRNTY